MLFSLTITYIFTMMDRQRHYDYLLLRSCFALKLSLNCCASKLDSRVSTVDCFGKNMHFGASQIFFQIPRLQLISYVWLWVCYLTFIPLCKSGIKYPPLLDVLNEVCVRFHIYIKYSLIGKYYNLLFNLLFSYIIHLFCFGICHFTGY